MALLALDRRVLERQYVAGTLWPDLDERHAAGCLRTAIWRLRQAGLDVLEVSRISARLRPDARVDVSDALDWAARVIDRQPHAQDLRWPELRREALDLMPGCYDDWIAPPREKLRQRVLHALDVMSELLSETGRHADAVDAAATAVSCEPLRESAQRALISAHLAAGNVSEARRAYSRFAELIRVELGISPSASLARLIGADVAVRTARAS